MKKITFKTEYFFYEVELESMEESPLWVIQECKDMIDTCRDLDFPKERSYSKTEETVDESQPFKFVPPSDKQKQIMDKFKIPYDESTSQEQASELIRESIAKSKVAR